MFLGAKELGMPNSLAQKSGLSVEFIEVAAIKMK